MHALAKRDRPAFRSGARLMPQGGWPLVHQREHKVNLSLKPILAGGGLMSRLAVACVTFSSMALASTPGLAQAASDNETTSIQRGTDAEKALKLEQPSYQTREERLRAKPLDWNSTIGTTTPKALTPSEELAARTARPGSAEGGAPDPHADEEARKLNPNDWP
jgi:hypothetical protein